MSTANSRTLIQKQGPDWGAVWFMILATILFASATTAAVVAVRNGAHAAAKHGADAIAIQCQLDNEPPHSVWQFTSWRRQGTFIQTTCLPDGRWGLRIIECTKAGWNEKTSFVPKDGSAVSLKEYVSARAVEFFGRLADMCK